MEFFVLETLHFTRRNIFILHIISTRPNNKWNVNYKAEEAHC
jgi:hypothetical protein